MSDDQLNLEEKEILGDFEAGEFKSVLTPERKNLLAKAAKEHFKKDKRINIRISSHDLEALQRRALEEGIPYQTFIASSLIMGILNFNQSSKHLALHIGKNLNYMSEDQVNKERIYLPKLPKKISKKINSSIGVRRRYSSLNIYSKHP